MKKFLTLLLLIFAISISCKKEDSPTSPNENTPTSVVIGTQEWTTKNLDVDHYRNGDIIPQITDRSQWNSATEGAWCYYDNIPENGAKWGRMYNLHAVRDPRGLAPEGWHLPTDEEWQTLVDYLGGWEVAGKKLKSTDQWLGSNANGTNESGFNAYPASFRDSDGYFGTDGFNAYYWTSTIYNNFRNYSWWLTGGGSYINRSNYDLTNGQYLRLVKD